ncbi:tannase/feruloyl esterase family alpha/beta hydrolase [Edaphobacter aggregans]|uniref:tannase/feruloyl esterase family alpha/beta hydrolase n=1 Tax=Edaphobacter aggregans TaxID=570835 RepID=UPI000A023122
MTGWDDSAISPLNSIAYYESVQKMMGGEKVASFVRLYMEPGMEHCIGGPGGESVWAVGRSEREGAGDGRAGGFAGVG